MITLTCDGPECKVEVAFPHCPAPELLLPPGWIFLEMHRDQLTWRGMLHAPACAAAFMQRATEGMSR